MGAVAKAVKKVTLLVHGHGSEFFPGKKSRVEVEVPAPACVNDILDAIGVNRSLVMFAVSNGVRQGKDYVPLDGEELIIVTPPSGG
ncbi:MAG: hypothetical protein NUV93_01125 [Firmicutes bacterium]|jgi:hypothetical protein|nr:hypothetical protein [Bacillota bacterium]